MKEIKRIPKDDFRKYLNAPPLEVPEDYSPYEAFRKMVEEGNSADHDAAARKVCRLIIEAAEKNSSVRRWLVSTRVIGDGGWNKLIQAIGRETPDIAGQINRLGPSHLLLNWAVFSAAYLVEGKE